MNDGAEKEMGKVDNYVAGAYFSDCGQFVGLNVNYEKFILMDLRSGVTHTIMEDLSTVFSIGWTADGKMGAILQDKTYTMYAVVWANGEKILNLMLGSEYG